MHRRVLIPENRDITHLCSYMKPKLKGIYILLSKGNVIDVGRSKHVILRVWEHWEGRMKGQGAGRKARTLRLEKGFDQVLFIPIEDDIDLRVWETFLQHKYKLKSNYKYCVNELGMLRAIRKSVLIEAKRKNQRYQRFLIEYYGEDNENHPNLGD